MAQGFKPLKRNVPEISKKKKKSNTSSPKVGKRIAPKKHAALQEVAQKKVSALYLKQRDTAQSTGRIEQEMAGRASKGPLSIMRKVADQADKTAKPKP